MSSSPELISYQGEIVALDIKRGTLTVSGFKLNGEEEEGIFQLEVDPMQVYVTKQPMFANDPEPIYEFSELKRGFQVDVECVVRANELIVETIYVLGRSSQD